MDLGTLPLWGQYGILGLSLGLNIFFVVQIVRGELVSRKELDQVQKTAETWQHGWEVGQQNQHVWTELLTKFNTLADALQHFIESLPKPNPKEEE